METEQLKELADLYLKHLYSEESYYAGLEPPKEYEFWLTDSNRLYITWTDYGGYKTEYYVNIWEIVYLLYKKNINNKI